MEILELDNKVLAEVLSFAERVAHSEGSAFSIPYEKWRDNTLWSYKWWAEVFQRGVTKKLYITEVKDVDENGKNRTGFRFYNYKAPGSSPADVWAKWAKRKAEAVSASSQVESPFT